MDTETFASQDSLYVNWHLLNGLNHDCPYSHEPDSVINERFDRESLLETAYRLLSLNRPEYVFHLYGGEPTIHPHFAELVHYLSTSGRNVRMILETNGIRQLKYYKGLLHSIAPERLCVRFAVHLKYMELEKLLTFVGFVVDQKQLCQVIVNWVPEYDAKTRLFYDKLTQFQRVLTFGLRAAFPMGGEAPWLAQFANVHKSLEPQFPAWTIVPGSDEAKAAGAHAGCAATAAVAFHDDTFAAAHGQGVRCAGVNAVQVAADGACTLGLVADDKPFAPTILSAGTLRDDLPVAKAFATEQEAAEWLQAFDTRALAYEIEGGPVRHPLRTDTGCEQKLRGKLKRLAPVSQYQRKLTSHPELWREKKETLLSIYEALADDASREVFLRRVKAQLFGVSAYLGSSEYAKFCHPECADIPYDENSPSQCRLRMENVAAKDVARIFPKIAWYRPSLELVLPAAPAWLDILQELSTGLSNYSIFLGQHGMQTVCYARPVTPRKRCQPLPLRTLDGNPLVSVILKARDDEEALAGTIASIEAERLPRYEVILVQDSSTMNESVDALVRKNPWHVRSYRFDEELSLTRAYDAGLDMAQGEYVCFVRPGEQITKGALAGAVQALEKDKSDLVLFDNALPEANIVDGKEVFTRFLNGELNHKGVGNKIYRASLIRDCAVAFQDLPGEIEDNLFNLPLLHFANTITCLKGDLVAPALRDELEEESTAEERFEAFTKSMGRISDFCAAQGIADSQAFNAYRKRLFQEAEADFTSVVHEADVAGNIDEVLTAEVLASLKQIPGIVSHLCRKCLTHYAKRSDLPKVEIIDALDMAFEEYAGAAENYEHEPKLSFVVTIPQGGSLSLLESLVEEDAASIECLVLNSAKDSETRDRLEELADLYPNVRLWHGLKRICLLQSMSLALKECKGSAITFLKGSDEVDGDFIERALKAFSLKENVDLAVFGLQSYDGESRDLSDLQEGLVEKGELARTIFQQGMSLDIRGIVFGKGFLQRSLADLDPVFPDEGDEYLLKILQAVTQAYVSSTGAVSTSEESETPLMVRRAKIAQSIEGVVCTLHTLLSAETATADDDMASIKSSNIVNYVKKVWGRNYLPLLVMLTEGDATKAEECIPQNESEISDTHFMALCAESSMRKDVYEQE